MTFQYLEQFSKKHQIQWHHILAAEAETIELRSKIENQIQVKIFSSDVDLVVFGSIARNECSKDSDVDWTLLIDGQSRPEHFSFGHIIRGNFLDAGLPSPGSSGMFGQMTFGHDLIHYIGGEHDTNHNISKRILMLLESDNIVFGGAMKGGTAYERILRGIINQYISNDSSYRSDRNKRVPRFLLNDIIRFWRTMCVDFAYKQKEQQGEKWALRNIKLRTSRKLIYVKGLLMCFSCYNNDSLTTTEEIENHLTELAAMKPIDILIKVCLDASLDENELVNILTAYDKFLGILSDSDERKKLIGLKMTKVYDDENFIKARKICDAFQESLTKLFITQDSKLKEFTINYGIF
jgi:predicted nucleotidyltransferase